MSELTRIRPEEGMLAYLVSRTRPELARRIAETGRIETAIVGLGAQGTRHAGLMKDFGTTVAAAVSPGEGLSRVHESIPVYQSVAEMMSHHPDIAAVSIWKHYSTAADAAIECIEADIPVVVVISEGIPVKDVRRVLVAARARGTLLLGPNTPGVIFPPERCKIGMLPDVFYPAEPEPGRYTGEGVSICSRSGAILYHMSDALASAGIAQNAVIGVGGDSAIGSPFPVIVPIVSQYPRTDLVVVAGEIGGCAEELLAEDIKAHPEKYPKPIVALISGRRSPEGKRMGHAGAIVAPGSDYGTWKSKKAALESAGVTVVNCQADLLEEVRKRLGGRRYFEVDRYYAHMRSLWEAPPPVPAWNTCVTRVEPNNLVIRGIPLVSLIGTRSLLEVAALIVGGDLPSPEALARLEEIASKAAFEPVAEVPWRREDDVSKTLAAMLLTDMRLAAFEGSDTERVAFALGRVAAYFARVFGHEIVGAENFSQIACQALAGARARDPRRARMLEAAMVASVDHGVTPPSAQTTLLVSSVRPALETGIAAGIMAITDVHGGAGAKAAEFFAECAALTRELPLDLAAERVIASRTATGGRIEGLGHRVHTRDPRRDALWKLAEETGVAGTCVAISRIVETAMKNVRGMSLPVNVDGVIGAVVADMELDSRLGKALFIFGRVAGLAAHYFEEIQTQPPMRRINFAQAVYRGK